MRRKIYTITHNCTTSALPAVTKKYAWNTARAAVDEIVGKIALEEKTIYYLHDSVYTKNVDGQHAAGVEIWIDQMSRKFVEFTIERIQ